MLQSSQLKVQPNLGVLVLDMAGPDPVLDWLLVDVMVVVVVQLLATPNTSTGVSNKV